MVSTKRAAALAALVICGLAVARAQSPNDWYGVGYDAGGSKYSPLTQITPANVSTLKTAWTYDLGAPGNWNVTPIAVNNILYFPQGSNIVALRADTGAELWKFDMATVPELSAGGGTPSAGRNGIAYWTGRAPEAPRIVVGVTTGWLLQLDAKTGKPIPGPAHVIDLSQGGIMADVGGGAYRISTSPSIYKNLAIIAGLTGEGGRYGEPGDPRAFDLNTGKEVWRFHVVPYNGEENDGTWGANGWQQRKSAGVWVPMSVDVANDLLFIPTGNATEQNFGGGRPGSNLYATTLLVLRASTGKRVWHFQITHHDVYDWDVSSQPSLFTATKNGVSVPAVAQMTKLGLLFMFNRLTGEPLWGIEERAIPYLDTPGDKAWPTEPFPLHPTGLTRDSMTRSEVSKISPEAEKYCTELFDKAVNSGPYTPYGMVPSLVFPGSEGGGGWGGVATNNALGLVFVNTRHLGVVGQLSQSSGALPSFSKAKIPTTFYTDPNGFPCNQPPWSELVAVSASTGDIVWRVPLGEYEELTVDFGVRFVHQVPQYDGYLKSSNFLPEKWQPSAAPLLYVAGCAGASPCSGTTRQAMNPQTGQLLGPGSAIAIGTLVPGTGSTTNGVFADGQGIVKTNLKYPGLKLAPRGGAAWDVSGHQTFVVRGSVGLFFDRPPAQNVYNTVNNPPFSRNITVRYGQLQDLASTGLATEAAPSLTVWQYDMKLPSSTQWSTGFQMVLPFSSALDVAYTGQHSFNTLLQANLNSIDLGAAFLPETQDSTQTSLVPGAASKASLNPELVRYYRGFGSISQQQDRGWRTYHSIQASFNRRFKNGLGFGFNDTISLYDHQAVTLRLQHNADGTITERSDQAAAQDLLGNNYPQTHIMSASFIWQLPKLTSGNGALHAIGLVANDWSLSGIWSGATPSAYAVTSTYVNNGNAVNITGSPDFTPRVNVVGDPGSGCSSDRLRQFNVAAFQGPSVGSVGLESGNGYLRGCFISHTDLAIARTIQLGHARTLQLRMDIFNTFNQAGVTNRVTSVQYANPSDPITEQNLPFDASGNLVDARSRPRGAGFGVASAYQSPRTMQAQIRFAF